VAELFRGFGWSVSGWRGGFRGGDLVDPLDVSHFGGVGVTLTEFGDPGVTTLAGGRGWGDFFEQFLHDRLLVQVGEGSPAGVEVTALAEGDHLFREGADGFGLGEGGFDLLVLDE